jgi:hypothetical protein
MLRDVRRNTGFIFTTLITNDCEEFRHLANDKYFQYYTLILT